MKVSRIAAVVGKELREFRANPAAVLPVAILMGLCITLPFLIVVAIPRMTGQTLAEDRAIRQVVLAVAQTSPQLTRLPFEAAVQAFLFQQFLLLFLIAPVVGAVTLAAHSVVGEKQGRTLEPLLTTPIATSELLLAKVLACVLPAVALEAVGLAGYGALVGVFAMPGVPAALLSARSFVLVGLVGPLGALAALQMTIAVSSRVNDPRSAQQIAVLLILPVVAMLVGQIVGAFIITTPLLLLVALALAIVWLILMLLSVALFDRETILTRWK